MLVLTRKSNQAVLLGSQGSKQVKVIVLSVDVNGCVKLGFEADNSIKILREELTSSSIQQGVNHGSPQ